MSQTEIERFENRATDVASFLKSWLSRNITVKINTDTDPDGISAGNIMARCLKHYDIPFHISFGPPPKKEDLEKLENQNHDLFIFIDKGTAQLPLIEKHLLEKNQEVLILDHHPGEINERPGLTCLNPHSFGLNGARDVSASGVAYSVVEKIDEEFRPLSEMAIIGALGDRQEFPSGFRGVNKIIVEKAVEEDILVTKEGLKLNGRTRPLIDCLSRSIHPYLVGLSGSKKACRELLEDLEIEPDTTLEELTLKKEEELRNEILERTEVASKEDIKHNLWGTIYTPKKSLAVGPKNIHEYITMLDACEKSDKIGIGFSALLGDESSKDEALKTLKDYQEKMIETINWFISKKDRIKSTPRMQYVYVGDELGTKMVGESLSVAIESGIIEAKKPVLGLSDLGEEEIKVSARVNTEYTKNGKHLGDVLKEVSEELGGSGGGHDVAAAARLPKESKDVFITKVDQLLE